jgi:hypothetical protein
MFLESRCDFCGDCLTKCKYIDFDRQQGAGEFAKLVKELKPSRWKQGY